MERGREGLHVMTLKFIYMHRSCYLHSSSFPERGILHNSLKKGALALSYLSLALFLTNPLYIFLLYVHFIEQVHFLFKYS
jgi:hypothetical protein